MATEDVQVVPINITQGNCETWLFTFNDSVTNAAINVSTWLFFAQIRELTDSTAVLANFSFSKVGLPTNQVRMSLTAAQTNALPLNPANTPGNFQPTKFTYDVKTELPDGCIYSIQKGVVNAYPSTTVVV